MYCCTCGAGPSGVLCASVTPPDALLLNHPNVSLLLLVLQIIKTATVPASACKRANTLQFHDSKIKFPLTRRLARPSAPEFRTLYKATRPSVAMI
jgi:hypothetical protein